MSFKKRWTALALVAAAVFVTACNPVLTPGQTPGVPTYYHVSGQSLYDSCGERVVVKGIEQFFANPSVFPDGRPIVHIGYTGANAVRVLPYIGLPGEPHEAGWRGMSVAQIEHLIQVGIANHMLVDVALAGGKTVEIYLRPDVKAMLLKYQRYIVI